MAMTGSPTSRAADDPELGRLQVVGALDADDGEVARRLAAHQDGLVLGAVEHAHA